MDARLPAQVDAQARLISSSPEDQQREALWPAVRFSDGEYRERHRRLGELLSRTEVGAVITDERTTWYLTGFGTSAPIGSRARPRVLIAGGDGLTFLVHRSTRRSVEEMVAPGVRVAAYDALGAPVAEIAAELREREARTVAGELGGELVSALGAGEWRRLEEELGQPLEPVEPLVARLRMLKSATELERIRRACELTGEAYDNVLPALPVGITERQVCGLMHDAMLAAGAAGAWVNCVIGEYDRVDGVARTRAAAPGDLVFVDAGANVGGYWSDFSRSAVIGTPSEAQHQAQSDVNAITGVGVGACRDGARVSTIADQLDTAMRERGVNFNTRPGRYGHGLGMTVTEAPDLRNGDDTRLEPGCVITVEPAFFRDDGVFHCEQIALVTDAAPEILTGSCSTELRAAG